VTKLGQNDQNFDRFWRAEQKVDVWGSDVSRSLESKATSSEFNLCWSEDSDRNGEVRLNLPSIERGSLLSECPVLEQFRLSFKVDLITYGKDAGGRRIFSLVHSPKIGAALVLTHSNFVSR
jgi:hypothetical protein